MIQVEDGHKPEVIAYVPYSPTAVIQTVRDVFAGKKYKPVDQKVRLIKGILPEEFRIIQDIKCEPLDEIPILDPNLPDFESMGCYIQERKEYMDHVHDQDFLWSKEMKAVHHLLML